MWNHARIGALAQVTPQLLVHFGPGPKWGGLSKQSIARYASQKSAPCLALLLALLNELRPTSRVMKVGRHA